MTFSREDTKAIKGIAIILMLYHHLFAFPTRIAGDIAYFSSFSLAGQPIAYWIGLFGKICVAIFLFLGGYGTYLTCSKTSDIASAITGKMKALYVSYWKVFVIIIPICMLVGVPRVTVNLRDYILNFTGLDISYCGEWWFFTTYVALLCFYCVVYRFVQKDSVLYRDLFWILLLRLFTGFILPNLGSYCWAANLSQSLFWNIFSEMLTYSPVFLMGCLMAKYDLLTKIKQRFSGSLVGVLGAIVILLCTFYMRKNTNGDWGDYDYLFAPVFIAAWTVLLENAPFRFLRRILAEIGSKSTTIWLVHSVYCYLLCQRLVFLPRYTVLIVVWLLFLSYLTAVVLQKFYAQISRVAALLQRRMRSPSDHQ